MLGILSPLTIKDIAHLSEEQVKYLQSNDGYCKHVMNRHGSFTEENGSFHIVRGLL